MSLATRCSQCGTIFRVVQDQLKVSEGWVRCGRCQQVFNALPNLFDLEREAPPPWPSAPGEAPAPEPDTGEWTSTQQPEANAPDEARDSAGLSTQPLLHTVSRDTEPPPPQPPLQDTESPETEAPEFADARFNLELIDHETGGTAAAALAALAEPLPDAAPEFVRQADRAARWQQPTVRGLMWGLLVAGTVSLGVQAALHFRAPLAAQWPESRALLGPLCAALSCRIEPPRHLDSLAVDSTGLAKLGAPGSYRLSVALHNRSRAAVMLPAVELTLTDAQGGVVARRVLAMADFAVQHNSLAAGADLQLQALLSTADAQRVVSYTVEIFYP